MSTDDINRFSMEIEELVYMNDIPYIDAVCMFCETHNLEIENVAKLVSGVLKSKIKLEAESLNFLPKTETSRLPI